MVAMSGKYTIKATPVRGRWSLVVDGVGVSTVRRLDQAIDEMRAAVVDLTGSDPDEIDMALTLGP